MFCPSKNEALGLVKIKIRGNINYCIADLNTTTGSKRDVTHSALCVADMNGHSTVADVTQMFPGNKLLLCVESNSADAKQS